MPLYTGINRGIRNALINYAAQDPYGAGFERGSRAALVDAQIRRDVAEAEAREFSGRQRAGIAEAIKQLTLPSNVPPEVVSGAFLSNDNPDARQLGGLLQSLQQIDIRNRAADATDVETLNRLTSVLSGKPYLPFSQSGTGPIVNRATGAVDPDSPITAAAISIMQSLANENAAQAGQAAAAADASRARAASIRSPSTASGKSDVPNAQLLKLFQEPILDDGGKPVLNLLTNRPESVLNTDAVRSAVRSSIERGTSINDELKRLLGAPAAEVLPEAATDRASPSGLISGAETPRAVSVDGQTYPVVGTLPNGNLLIRDPVTGRTGIYSQ